MTERILQMFLSFLNKLKFKPNYILEKIRLRGFRCYPLMPKDIDWYRSNVDILRLINVLNITAELLLFRKRRSYYLGG